jgi:hypothetical protein
MKILVWGSSKSGKSFFLAHMPHPIFAIDAGEGGIQQYLDTKLGDECFEATTPDQFSSIKIISRAWRLTPFLPLGKSGWTFGQRSLGGLLLVPNGIKLRGLGRLSPDNSCVAS